MSNTKKGIITGMFKDRESAENAYNDLLSKGYSDNEIHLVMSRETHEKNSGSPDTVGETGSALISILAAVSTLVPVPGIGLMMTGPIASSLAEDGAEDLPGNFISALIGYGVPADYANEYASGIKAGNIIIGVHPHHTDDAEYFSEKWGNLSAEYIYKQAIT